jgi:hypothetical protein
MLQASIRIAPESEAPSLAAVPEPVQHRNDEGLEMIGDIARAILLRDHELRDRPQANGE